MLTFVLGGWVTASEAQPSIPGKWTITSCLAAARQCHTATMLRDGRVLIVGGYGNSSELATAELYDPIKGVFTRTADLAQGRSNHTATLLTNGQVLVVGGQSGGSTLTSAEIYNPSTGVWTPTGSLHFARSYHTATLLSDGDVLVAGGIHWASPPVFAQGAPPGSALDLAELYDPATGKWTVTDNMHTARYAHASILLPDGDVLVMGGIGSRRDGPMSADDEVREIEESPRAPGPMMSEAVDSAEIFDHKTKTWTVTGHLIYARYHVSATLLPNGQVLVSGGSANGSDLAESELYSISSRTWASTGSLQIPRCGHTSTLLPNGKVLVAGGANTSAVFTSAELFDPSTGKWETAASMNQPHALHTATLLANGKVLVCAGGYALGAPNYDQPDAELFDFAEHTLAGTQNPTPRYVPPVIINPLPAPPVITPPYFANFPPPPPSMLTVAGSLVLATLCIVIVTGCVVVLLAAWLVFVLIRRWCR